MKVTAVRSHWPSRKPPRFETSRDSSRRIVRANYAHLRTAANIALVTNSRYVTTRCAIVRLTRRHMIVIAVFFIE